MLLLQKPYKISVLLLLFFLIIQPSVAQWELVLDRDDIKVFNKPNEDGYSFYRAEVELNHEWKFVYTFFLDIENYPNWVNNCDDVRLLSEKEDERYVYTSLFGMPWPIQDRYAISSISVSEAGPDTVLLVSTPANDFEYTWNDALHITRFREEITLFAKTDTSTFVTLYGAYDPAGNIPSWLTDKLMKFGPYDTILKIRKELENRKPDN